MPKALITGATGNVGKALLEYLNKQNKNSTPIAGVRKLGSALEGVQQRLFDFLKPNTFKEALKGCELLFLVRPPQLSDAQLFVPLLQEAKAEGLKHVIFLSVQGAESNRYIPHYKIEKLIKESGLSYTFLRPAYFMQNFLNQHFNEITKNRRVFVPAGQARFTVIDVNDIAETAASVMNNINYYSNTALTLTNSEQLNFSQMCAILSDQLGVEIKFTSPNLLRFYIHQKGQGHSITYLLVLIMLHYLPRFTKVPPTTLTVKEVCGKPAKNFAQFTAENKHVWLSALSN